jgi:hypothetical protein
VRDIADVTNDTRRLFALPMDYDEHIARHDPARVLAQCAALRAVVEQYHRWRDPADRHILAQDERLVVVALETTLRALASIWAEHDEWREEWAL